MGVRAKPGNGRALEDIGSCIHAHPTLGEAVQEGGFAPRPRPLHL
jgi:hypothetical protein